MSASHYDLGARLRSAATGKPVRTSSYTPCLPLDAPIALAVTTDDGHTQVHAHDGTQTATATAAEAMTMLIDLGVRPGETHRTAVVEDRATLAQLARIARTTPDAPAAPVIAWWEQRADHPGSGAVHQAVLAARERWTLGVAPERERQIATWRAWLGIEDDGVVGLLDLARRTCAGSVLPGLLDLHGADSRSWQYLQRRLARGWQWHRPDGRREAALGLATREHAAQLYESLRLRDPAVARREQYTGRLVAGTVVDTRGGDIVLQADRPLSRLRVGAEVAGWVGPADGEHAATHWLRTGRVAGAQMDLTATLRLTVSETVARPGPLPLGARVTLRPKPADPAMQARERRNLTKLFARSGNWIAGRGAPTIRRSDVPLDVVLAAAPEA